jgi:hypothetical protein
MTRAETLSTAVKTNDDTVITLSEWEFENPVKIDKGGATYFEIKEYPKYRFFLIRRHPQYAPGGSQKLVVRAEPA